MEFKERSDKKRKEWIKEMGWGAKWMKNRAYADIPTSPMIQTV